MLVGERLVHGRPRGDARLELRKRGPAVDVEREERCQFTIVNRYASAIVNASPVRYGFVPSAFAT